MTEMDDVIARLSRLGVITSTDEAPGSVLNKVPESKFADDTSLDKPTKDDCSGDLASSKFAQLSRVDSHEGGADSITSKSQLAQTQEELQRVETELHQAKEEIEKLRREVEDLSKAENDLATAKLQIIDLTRRSSDKSLQFRVVELKDDSKDTQIEMIRTFRFGPKNDYHTGEPVHSRPTIAYMDMEGHLARNGKVQQEPYINSSYWATEARNIFKGLNSPWDDTLFQHAEAQLMAMCVDHFLGMAGLELIQFKNKKPVANGAVYSMLEVVEIFTSRKPCSYCDAHKVMVNKIAAHYGFQFELTYANVVSLSL